jgi:ion channel
MMVMLVGSGVTLSALIMQGVAVTLGVEAMGVLIAKRLVGTHVLRNGAATLLLIVMLLTGHLAQMALWAWAFMGPGEFPTFAVALYHSADNYTTLGYGDLVMSEHWRLLGPQEPASGTFAFGWSTAAIVTVVIRLLRYRHRAHV